MDRSRTLLTRTNRPLSIAATARAVGYRNPSGLRQAFVRFYGVAPSAIQPKPVLYLGTLTPDQEVEATGSDSA